MTIIIAILALSFLIVIHEMGHYWAAKWLKIPVISFSLGFGPVLYEKRNKEGVSFSLRAILIGGYVRFFEEDIGPFKAFDNHALWKRFIVVIAGPLANLILAYLIFMMVGGLVGVSGVRPVVGEVIENTPAAAAQIEQGDTIVAVDNNEIYLWRQAVWGLINNLGKDNIKIDLRDEDNIERSTLLDLGDRDLSALESDDVQNVIGILPDVFSLEAIVGEVQEGSPAEQAGIQAFDRIISISTSSNTLINIAGWQEMTQIIQQSANQELRLEVLRDGELRNLELTPEFSAERQAGIAGISVFVPDNLDEIQEQYFATVRYPLGALWSYAAYETWTTLELTVKSLYQLIVGILGIQSLGGPVRIVDVVGQSFDVGWGVFLRVVAVINLSLFFFNLLPIPALDGGHIVLQVIEAIRGKKPSARFIGIYSTIGFVLLMSLFIFVTINDIVRLL